MLLEDFEVSWGTSICQFLWLFPLKLHRKPGLWHTAQLCTSKWTLHIWFKPKFCIISRIRTIEFVAHVTYLMSFCILVDFIVHRVLTSGVANIYHEPKHSYYPEDRPPTFSEPQQDSEFAADRSKPLWIHFADQAFPAEMTKPHKVVFVASGIQRGTTETNESFMNV